MKGVDEELIVFPVEGLSLEAARIAIDKLRNTPFVNAETRIVARLSSSAKGKLISNKATGKSKANGFTKEQHNILAANVGRLFESSRLIESRPDREADPNIISIKRFARFVFFGEKEAVAWITLKESKQHGHHIYSVESIKVEALDRIVEVVSGNTPHASSAPMSRIVAYLCAIVNGVVDYIRGNRN